MDRQLGKLFLADKGVATCFFKSHSQKISLPAVCREVYNLLCYNLVYRIARQVIRENLRVIIPAMPSKCILHRKPVDHHTVHLTRVVDGFEYLILVVYVFDSAVVRYNIETVCVLFGKGFI